MLDKKEETPINKISLPILMVSQLWVWRCDQFLLTAFWENALDSYKNCARSMRRFMPSDTPSISIAIGLLIAHQVSEFGNPQADRGFDNAIFDVKFPSALDLFEASAAQVLTDVNAYIKSNELSKRALEDENDFLFRIADIREELVMIGRVLAQQLEILQSFIDDYELYNPDSHNFFHPGFIQEIRKMNQEAVDEKKIDPKITKHWEQVKEATKTIKKYQERVRKIDQDAMRIQERIQDQMNLKRTYASMDDARASLTLGIAVIGFTIVTIIFAPLAFMTALFALPIDTLLSNQLPFKRPSSDSGTEMNPDTTAAYSTTYIGKWFAAAELASLAVTVFVVAVFVWLFNRNNKFSTLRKHYSRNKLSTSHTDATGVDGTDTRIAQEQTGLRKRTRKLCSFSSYRPEQDEPNAA
ncbi:hypothetical protein F4777DRAFT_549543 [Nemania sp. FL0916]|nr:hypothetical protein F4777DRAFT_549543 [Nemania sp. FL0916]